MNKIEDATENLVCFFNGAYFSWDWYGLTFEDFVNIVAKLIKTMKMECTWWTTCHERKEILGEVSLLGKCWKTLM